MWRKVWKWLIVAGIAAVCCMGVFGITGWWDKVPWNRQDAHVYEKGVQRMSDSAQHGIEGTNLTELENRKRQERDREDEILTKWIEGMTTEQKLAQCMILTNEKDINAWNLQTYQPGGVIFFGVDFKGKTVEQVAARVKGLQQCMQVPLFVGVDEEGGQISRVKGLLDEGLPRFDSARELYAKGTKAVIEDVEKKTALLERMGINLNFDPVADVVNDPVAYMYDRSASGDAEEAADYVKTVISVMKDQKIGSCLKHFPGYGNNANTHATFANDKKSLVTYRKQDFVPYRAGVAAGAEMIMVSHITMECVDRENLASLSGPVHTLLREELAFDGVVMADDLNMQAILMRMSLEEATGQALEAGNDMVFSADFAASMRGAKHALQSGQITETMLEDSVRRILRYKLHLGMLEEAAME